MGKVSAMPTSTDTIMPIKNGCISVACIIMLPKAVITALTPGPARRAISSPDTMVTVGVTRISTFVSLDTSLPSSAAITAHISVPKGPPRLLAPTPTAHRLKSTSGGALSASPMATAMLGPVA